MKKIITFLLMGSLCAGAILGVAGCGSTEEASSAASEASSVISSETSSEASSEASSESSSESSSEASSKADSDSSELKVVVDKGNYDNDFIGEFPQIEGSDSDVVMDVNAQINRVKTQFEEDYNNYDGVKWTEVHDHSMQNDKYISLVVTYNQFPTYADSGTVYSYIYDVENDAAVPLDEAIGIMDVSEDDLKEQFEATLKEDEKTQYRVITDFSFTGAALNADGSGKVYVTVNLEDGEDTPADMITTSSKEIYTYNTSTQTFTFEVQ